LFLSFSPDQGGDFFAEIFIFCIRLESDIWEKALIKRSWAIIPINDTLLRMLGILRA